MAAALGAVPLEHLQAQLRDRLQRRLGCGGGTLVGVSPVAGVMVGVRLGVRVSVKIVGVRARDSGGG